MIFCNLQQQLVRRAVTDSNCHVHQKSNPEPWLSSSSAVTSTLIRSLPSPGTPINILEFVTLSPSEQKKWLEQNGATVSRNVTHHADTEVDEDYSSEGLSLPLSASVDSMGTSGGSLNDTEKTFSLSSGSSARAEEDDSSSTCTFESDNHCSDNGNKRTSRRSIFAPYWTKIGAHPLSSQARLLEDGNPSSSTQIYHHEPERNNEKERTTNAPASAAAQTVPTPSASGTTPTPPTSPRRSIFGLNTQSIRDPSKSLQEIQVPAPHFVYVPENLCNGLCAQHHKKTRSASFISSPPKESILRRKGQGDEDCRQRSHSFSVKFDSKVDVVLFHDPSLSPWWLQIVGGNDNKQSSRWSKNTIDDYHP